MNSKGVFVCLLSWINFQFFNTIFLKFLMHMPTYGFMLGLDDGLKDNLSMSNLYLMVSSWIFSFCISIILIEVIQILLQIKNTHKLDVIPG